MASIEKYGIYLYIWIGLIYFAAGCTLPFCQFEQWCKNQHNAGYCEGANCTEGLSSDKSCFTVLPFDPSGMTVNQQHSACNYYSPYDVKEAYGINGSITCKYVLLNHGFEPVRIQFNGSNVAMSTKIDGMNGIELGETIQQNTDHLKTFCVKSAERIPNEDRYKDLTTAGRVEYFITDNVYQPEYDANNKPSVKKYHEHCKKIFPQSVAALPNDYLNLLAKEKDYMKGKILHVAGQIGDFAHYPSCGNKPDSQTSFIALSKNGKPFGINNTVYAPGYPNNKCADKPRTILTIHKTAGILNGVVDEPEFARHPLLCIRGNSPEQRRAFVCPDDWKMSVRPNTNPYCFLVSFPEKYSSINESYYGYHHGVSYDQSKRICKDHFNASLAIIEYPSDKVALGGEDGWTFYLNVKPTFTAGSWPAGYANYDWVALNGTTIPIDRDNQWLEWYWFGFSETISLCALAYSGKFWPYLCDGNVGHFACMKEAEYL